ncbi:MAG: hypothetical protein ACXW05_14980 [Gemmatirosa sp.]
MRKIVGSALVVVATLVLPACRSAAPIQGSTPVAQAGPGAGTPSGAIEGFLQAASANDPNAMARLFGTAGGPITEREGSEAVEKRMRALACYLTHDGSRIVDNLPGVGAGRAITVELKQRELTRRTRFSVVPGPGGRWFVEQFDINSLSDFCRPSPR